MDGTSSLNHILNLGQLIKTKYFSQGDFFFFFLAQLGSNTSYTWEEYVVSSICTCTRLWMA